VALIKVKSQTTTGKGGFKAHLRNLLPVTVLKAVQTITSQVIKNL